MYLREGGKIKIIFFRKIFREGATPPSLKIINFFPENVSINFYCFKRYTGCETIIILLYDMESSAFVSYIGSD